MKLVELQEDPNTGELVLELDPDTLNQMGWDVGDNIVWTIQEDGSVVLEKNNDS
jgi:formylmethanofuran dehydrogenase subunit D